MPKLNTTDDLLKLERAVRKIITKTLKDRTLDYTVQFAVSSLEPKKVKYAFMINGTKKEVRIEPQSFYSYDKALAVAEAMLKEFNPIELEKTFHESRIQTHKNTIKQHEDRLKQLENPTPEDEEDMLIPMEEMGATSLVKEGDK